jgi:hypothetical protein
MRYARNCLLTASVLAVLSAMALLVSTPPATAATWGQFGPAYPNTTTCRLDRIDITPPYIQPAVDTGLVGGWQSTAYISVLKRWDQARGAWVAVSQSQPYFHKADWVFMAPELFDYLSPYGWRSTDKGHSFPMAGRSGYFTVTHEFYWFDNVNGIGTNKVTGQRDLLPNEVFDERRYPFVRNLGYCLY